MRRFAVVLALATLVVTVASAEVSAGSLIRDHYESGYVRCHLYYPQDDLIVWLFVDPYRAELLLGRIAQGETDDVSMTPTGATATIPLHSYGGIPLGEDAVVELTLTPDGKPIEYREVLPRDGNVLSWVWTTAQLLSVDGTLVFRGTVYPVTGCDAVWESVTISTTNPVAHVSTWSGGPELACSFGLGATSVRLYAATWRGHLIADLLLDDRYGVARDATFHAGTFEATFELFTWDGEPTGTFATARAELSWAGVPQRTREGPESSMIAWADVSGVLSIPGLGDLDLSSCTASRLLHYAYLGTPPMEGA